MIAHFHFARQPTKTELLAKISLSVMLAWLVYATLKSQRATAQSHAATLGKGKVFPYSLPSVGPGADPGVQAVSPQVT